MELYVLQRGLLLPGTLGIQFVLETAPSHVSIPPNQNGTVAKDG